MPEAEQQVEMTDATRSTGAVVDPLAWLPELMRFDWNDYDNCLEAVHQAFKRDLLTGTRIQFQGRPVNTKFYPDPIGDGRGATFWHLVTEGNVETNREPVSERCERICWIRPVILEACAPQPRVLIWPQDRKGRTRWVIALPDFSYIVVLESRDTYVLLWTAYPIEYDHSRDKYRKQHAEHLASISQLRRP